MKAYLWFAFQRRDTDARCHLRRCVRGVSDHTPLPGQPRRHRSRRITSRSSFSPEAIDEMRAALTELYGVDKPLLEQYVNFWRRFLQGDFGPSLLAFPTPAMDLVMRALPWTVVLLSMSVGHLDTGQHVRRARWLLSEQPSAQDLRGGRDGRSADPLLHRRLHLAHLLRFRVADPADLGRLCNERQAGVEHRLRLLDHEHAILPVTSLIVVGFGTWFLGMRALVSNIVTEDYVTYAELAGVERGRIVGSYVIRNAPVPQLTALAMALGAIFSGTVITEQVFNYPGLGTLLVDAVNAGDNTTVLAVSTVSDHGGCHCDLRRRPPPSPPRSADQDG